MPLSDNIKKIRKLKKFTVADLAGEMKINVQSIYAWERGEYDPTKENLESMAAIFKVPVKTFYDENITEVDKATDNKEKGLNQVYRDLVESNSEYRLVPKILMDDYEIISKREAEERKKIVDAALQSKQDLINQLKSEIASLRGTSQSISVHAQETK